MNTTQEIPPFVNKSPLLICVRYFDNDKREWCRKNVGSDYSFSSIFGRSIIHFCNMPKGEKKSIEDTHNMFLEFMNNCDDDLAKSE